MTGRVTRKPPAWTTAPAKQRVMIAYPHPEEAVNAQFHRSLVSLMVHDAHRAGHVVGGGGHAPLASGAQITKSRNKIVREFLKTDIDWLWCIDTDMTFEPDTLDRLLASAHKTHRPIVGGLCFSLMRGDAVEIAPTLYQFPEDGREGFVRQLQYPPDTLIPVAGTGAACLLIHRSVLETMRDATREGRPRFPKPWPWFAETPFGEDSISEDLTFCLRANALGFPIHVDTSVKIGHVKPIVIDEGSYISQSMYLQAQADALAAEAPTYVVVPVADEIEGEWPANTLVIPNDGPLNLSAKWNRGLEWAEKQARDAGHEKWNVAILNDDLQLGPDVLVRLAAALREQDDHWIAYPDHRDLVPSGRFMATQSNDLAGQTMSGWCFMVRGESGLRADERFRWWYGDSDLERQVRDKKKLTVAVGGCQVIHLHPMESSKRPELLQMAKEDEQAFAEKWSVKEPLWLALHPEWP